MSKSEFRIRAPRSDGRGAFLVLGQHTAYVAPEHFRTVDNDAELKWLFAHAVHTVTIELTAFCNRRCQFCPNHKGARHDPRNQANLPEDAFRRVIGRLAEIGYHRCIYFHLFNEPLAAPDILLPRLSYARQLLPHAELRFNTNGDYLTAEMLARVAASGCSAIFVSIYGPDHGRWDETYIRNRVAEFGAKLGLKGRMTEKPGFEHKLSGTALGVRLDICGRNLWESGYDRGNLVPDLAVERSAPCLSPFSECLIDYRGYVLPCCNIYTDAAEHLTHTLGNVLETDIFAIYGGVAAQAWRRGTLAFDPKGACASCSRDNDGSLDTPHHRRRIALLLQALTDNTTIAAEVYDPPTAVLRETLKDRAAWLKHKVAAAVREIRSAAEKRRYP